MQTKHCTHRPNNPGKGTPNNSHSAALPRPPRCLPRAPLRPRALPGASANPARSQPCMDASLPSPPRPPPPRPPPPPPPPSPRPVPPPNAPPAGAGEPPNLPRPRLLGAAGARAGHCGAPPRPRAGLGKAAGRAGRARAGGGGGGPSAAPLSGPPASSENSAAAARSASVCAALSGSRGFATCGHAVTCQNQHACMQLLPAWLLDTRRKRCQDTAAGEPHACKRAGGDR